MDHVSFCKDLKYYRGAAACWFWRGPGGAEQGLGVAAVDEYVRRLRSPTLSWKTMEMACEEQLERAQAEIQILMAGKDGLSEEDRMKRLHSVGASLNKQRRGVGGSSTAAVGAGKVRVCASLPPSLRFAL